MDETGGGKMKFDKNSIQAKLTLVMALLVVAAMALLGGAGYWQASRALRESVDETAYATSEHYASQVEA